MYKKSLALYARLVIFVSSFWFLLVPICHSAGGDDSAFVRSSIANMAIDLKQVPIVAIYFYDSVRNADQSGKTENRQFAFSPYFQFVKFDEAQSAFFIRHDNDNGTSNIKLRLALYGKSLAQAAAAYMSLGLGQTVGVNSMQPLPIYKLTISDKISGLSKSFPDEISGKTSLVLPPTMDVTFINLSKAKADEFVKNIKNGNTEFSFKYTYKKASTVMSAYGITYKDVADSRGFQQLTGGGGAGFITRNGVARVASQISTGMEVSSYLENASESSVLVEDLLRLFLDKMKFKETIDFTKREDLQKISSLSIDPRGVDFEAERISRTHEILTTSKDYNDVNKKLIEGGIEAGYGPFTGKANFKSNEEVTKAVKETFNNDWTGNDWKSIPKTVNVYQVTGSDFQAQQTLRQVAVKPEFSFDSFMATTSQTFPTIAELDAAAKSQDIDRFVLVPVGGIMAYSGPINPTHPLPTNWKLCNGDALKSVDYPSLYNAIGTAHGDGRNQNNEKIPGQDFNLPDYQGYFLRGLDLEGKVDKGFKNRTVARTGGIKDDVGSIQGAATARPSTSFTTGANDVDHTHNFTVFGGAFGNGDPSSLFRPHNQKTEQQSTAGESRKHTHIVDGGGDEETRPINSAVNWIIRVR